MSAAPVDARAMALCSNCNSPMPPADSVTKHCPSANCTWWKCRRCGADNDEQGRNSVTSLSGQRKDGRK